MIADTDKATAAALREAADHMHNVNAAIAEGWRREADRLDPPAPTGKTVTWNGLRHRLTSDGRWVEYERNLTWMRAGGEAEFYAVVLPLLADAPDGPIPDEMARKAWDTYLDGGTGIDGMRAALDAVRGLPGMAVVRTGTPVEVLEWGYRHKNGIVYTGYASREGALKYCAPGESVVAIIADPGGGTV